MSQLTKKEDSINRQEKNLKAGSPDINSHHKNSSKSEFTDSLLSDEEDLRASALDQEDQNKIDSQVDDLVKTVKSPNTHHRHQ